MSKRLYKILEIIGILVIIFITFNILKYANGIFTIIIKVLLPFIIAFSIAFILEPVILFFEKRKLSRKFSVAIISVLFIFLIFLLCKYAGPLIVRQVTKLIQMLPDYINQLEDLFNNITDKMESLHINFKIDFDKIENILNDKLTSFLGSIGSFLQESFSYLIQIIITPVLAVYFMLFYENIEEVVKEKLKEKEMTKTYNVFSQIKKSLRNYIKGVLIVMAILTIASSICLLIVKIEYAFLFGVIIGITDIIPYIGPYIGGGIVVIFTLVAHPTKVIIVLVIIVILQFLESNFLVPKVQSKTMETNPIFVLLSIAFFGEILGIFGMIIAVPLVKIIEIIIKTIFVQKK